MGHVAFSKGFYDLILAFMRLRSTVQIRLLFAGEQRFIGNARKSIRAFLNGDAAKYFEEHAPHIEKTIQAFVDNADSYGARYLGVVDGEEKERAFATSDIFVLPSYTEGFSMSVLEAMAHGLPIVATRVGALPEIIKEGEHGFLVDPGDCDSIVGALGTLAMSPSTRAEMGVRNRTYIRERFRIERIAGELETILEEA
jgi:glycosyltransferase involved in cell wall biosynthesis